MTGIVTLGRGATAVRVAPEHGGRIAGIAVDGLELLAGPGRPGGAGPLQWGCYPMVPWAGRLDRGELRFAGAVHRFPLTMPPHAIHGTTWHRAWTVVDHDETGIQLAVDLAEPWPFGGSVLSTIRLTGDGLTWRLAVEAGEQAMPAALGWHPWFRRQLATGGPVEIDLPAAEMWLRGDDGLPTGERVPPPAGPWDDCFTGLTGPAALTWPGALRLGVESDCSQTVVYDQQADAVCVEPQSEPPDGLNRDPMVVGPGQALSRTMRLRWSAA